MWVFYTLLSSFLIAVYYFGNQFTKVSGHQFLIYRGFVPFLVFMLPYLIVRGLCDVINKFCIGFVPTEHLSDGNCLYIMITSGVIGFVNLFLYLNNGGQAKKIVSLKSLPYILIVIVLIFQMLPRNLAMYSTPNPSFVTALMYMYVIWIMLAGKILEHFINSFPKSISKAKVCILLLSVCLLILTTT